MTDEKHLIYHLNKLGYKSYREYLVSDHWLSFKKYFYKNSNRIITMRKNGGLHCEFCKCQAKLNLHHKTYERLGNERSTDLIILCDNCHNTIHQMDRSISLPSRTRRLRKKIKYR